jgi:alpha-galactosidase
MIYFNKEKNDIHIQTVNSSYIIRILEEGHLASLYFGEKLENKSHFSSLYKRREASSGVSYNWKKEYSMIGECYEFSYCDKGDYRESSIDLIYSDGSITCDFLYQSHNINKNKLEILLKDVLTELVVKLHYMVDGEKIIRYTELENRGDAVKINHLSWTTFDTNVLPLKLNGIKLNQGVRIVDSEKGKIVLENDDLIYTFQSESEDDVTGKFEKSPLNLIRVNFGEDCNFILGQGESHSTAKVALSYENKNIKKPRSGRASVEVIDDVFYLRTNSLSYCFNTELNHLYFGTSADENLDLSNTMKEFSPDQLLQFEGVNELDFKYMSYELSGVKEELNTLPSSHSSDTCLRLLLSDKKNNIDLVLTYGLFYKSDCFTRSLKVINKNREEAVVTKALSFTIPFADTNFNMMSLDGDWISERHINMRKLAKGRTYIDSKKGSSSNSHNPFIALTKDDTTEFRGTGIGFSLIYSGNHIMQAEIDSSLSVSGGINPHFFAYHIKDEFETPEVVFTYSCDGLNRMSQNFHSFVNNHICPGQFREKERPVLINNWEATYFDFNERKLLSMATKAQKLGIELFVLDDGWFGKRDDDTSSLGDFSIYKKKLKNGLAGLCRKINKKGLDFGLWVEPEMISIDSRLYEEHPEYLLKHPHRELSFGRNQGILDYANPEVVDYIYNQLERVFSSCNLKYVKWDMNRNFSDTYSNYLKDQRECTHKYMLGVYDLFKRIMKRFPDILFEGCAAGGDRFDMGILCYFPQIWTSDCTDATERTYIQYGTSMVYPQSVICAQVTADINHQLLRPNPIETRFNVASFASLGFSLNLKDVSSFNKSIIKNQIAFYKEHRKLLQFGKLTRMESPYESNYYACLVSNEDSSENIYINFQELVKSSRSLEIFKLKGLNDKYNYKIENRQQITNVKIVGELLNHVLPFRIRQNGFIHNTIDKFYKYKLERENIGASGPELNYFGFIPKHQFTGSEVNDNVRLTTDFSSRLYLINKVD